MADVCTQNKNINIERLASFAGLSLSEAETAVDEAYLNKMLNWANTEMAMKIDAHKVDTVTHVFNTMQLLRTDTVTETNQREAYQAIAPQVVEGLYLVPSIME